MLKQILVRLNTMEISQRREVYLEYVSEDEEIAPNPNLECEEDQDEERLLRFLSMAHLKPTMEVVPCDVKLDTNVVLDQISYLEKFFEFEGTPNNRKMKFVVTGLKGHASLWWENFQNNRQGRGKI